MDLPSLCTVGAAESVPPASGRIALFSIAMEFDFLSPALPVVAADEVVQLVSGLSPDGVVDCAAAAPTTSLRKVLPRRGKSLFVSNERRFSQDPKSRTFPDDDGSIVLRSALGPRGFR